MGNADCMAMLEEVYRQATAAAPLLHAKVAALSLESRSAGSQILPVMRSEAAATEMQGKDKMTSSFKPCHFELGASAALGVKPWRRAVEKLVRCYGGDATLLLDCCRQEPGCL